MTLNLYQKIAITTVVATLFLIFVGGLVRASGAGLGCPDWPKCFGVWIPPLDAADLPAEYNQSEFNVVKTWTEYINRLVGVVIGLLIIATFATSLRYRKTKPAITWCSGIALILVVFQGWLGGQVVETGLAAWLITIHMMLAFVIVNVLLYATFKATEEHWDIEIPIDGQKKLFYWGSALLVLTLIQVVIGTQVREGIDIIKDVAIAPPRETWLDMVGNIFLIHRSYSWIILINTGMLFFLDKKYEISGFTKRVLIWIYMLIAVQMFAGIGLNYLDMPAILQILHLTSVAVLVCAEFLLLLSARFAQKNVTEAL